MCQGLSIRRGYATLHKVSVNVSRSMRARTLISSLTALMLLGACAPHSVNNTPLPLVEMSARYATTNTGPVDNTPWYSSFHDPKLTALIEQALAGNLDVKQAAARYKQAEALAQQSGATRLPEVGITGRAGQNFEGRNRGNDTAEAGATLAWELDLFNRLSSTARADQKRQQAAAADLDAVRLLLSTEIAFTYYGAVAQQKQLTLLKQQIEADHELLRLNKLRLQEGIDSKVDVLQQQGQLAESRSLIPIIEAQLRVYENRLDILLGVLPDNANRTAGDEALAIPQDLPATGAPIDLLNRPDLKAQRLALVAADEDIGAAIAERLPRISVSASSLFVGGDGVSGPVTGVLGTLVQPLLDWGKRRAAVARNKAVYEEQLYGFTQSFIVAVGDVENALYQEQKQREYLKKLQRRQHLLSETLDKTQAQYKQGLNDYLPVLSTVKELRQVERSITIEELGLIDYRIQLHKALGSRLPTQP